MPYIGQRPATGEANSFKILDEISSYTLTFDGSSASVVSVANDTITAREHRFITGQRVTYNDGGGTAITGLSDGVYYIIVEDRHTFKLATSANNAASGTAVNITGTGAGAAHTINVAFDGVNTKFKATVDNGTRADITRSGQLMLSVNGVVQEPHDNTTSPATGYSTDHASTIIFSVAPAATDQFFGRLIASNVTNFDISDNAVDNFTGDGSTTSFSLSKSPASNQNLLVTIDGVVQYPDDTSAERAYDVAENVLTFTSAPGNGAEIQVRHIGFAGATSSSVTGFYGRTGNAALKSTDNIVFNDATASGDIQAANVTVTGDLTVQGTTTTLDTELTSVDKLEVAANNTTVGAAITQTGTGDILNLYDGSTEVFSVADGGDVTITDSIIHSGDENTKIRFPAADTVTVETGGSERARITGLGSFGVGTASPTARLDVRRGDADGKIAEFHQSTGYGFDIGSSQTEAYIASGYNQSFILKTDPSSGPVERVRITKDGNIGIGTAAPDQSLEVFKSAGTNLIKVSSQANSVNGIEFEKTGSTTQSWRIVDGQSINGALEFYDVTNSATSMIIRGGKIGIGTIVPAEELHIHASGTAYIKFTDESSGVGGGSDGVVFGLDHPHLYAWNYEAGDFVVATNASEKLRVTSGGDVGIGDNNPDSSYGTNLSIYDSGSNGARIKLADSTSGKGSGDGFDLIDVGGTAYLINRDPGAIVLSTNNTERLRIDSSGNVTLGYAGNSLYFQNGFNNRTSRIQNGGGSGNANLKFYTNNAGTEAEKLRITAAGNLGIGNDGSIGLYTSTDDRNLILGTGSGSSSIQVHSSTSGWGGVYFGDSTSGTARYEGYLEYNHSNNYIRLATNQVERLRITSGGNIGINQTSPNAPLSFATAAGQKIELYNSGSNNEFGFGIESSEMRICTGASSFMSFYTNGYSGNERLRITAAGQIEHRAGSGDNQYVSKRTNTTSNPGDYFFHLRAVNNSPVDVGYLGFHRDTANDDSRFVIGTRNPGGSTTERMRIDSNGHICFGSTGVTSDSAWAHSQYGNVEVSIDGSGGYGVLHFRGDGAGTSNTRYSMGCGDDRFYMAYDDVNTTHRLEVHNSGKLVTGLNITMREGNSSEAFKLESNGANGYFRIVDVYDTFERLRIHGDGIFSINTADASTYAQTDRSPNIDTTSSSAGGNFTFRRDKGTMIIANDADPGWALMYINKFGWSSGKDSRWISFYLNGQAKDTVSWNGSNIVYGTASDYRIKKNVRDFTSGIDQVKQLKVRLYDYIDTERGTDHVGFIAHELQEVIPEAVDGVKDGMRKEEETDELIPALQSVEYGKVTPVLTAALQEALAKIEALEARIAALES
jgi:hypothetical protein